MNADRLSRGWTYSDLAVESELSVQTVMRFFKGTFRSPKTAKRLAHALGYPLNRYLVQPPEAVAS